VFVPDLYVSESIIVTKDIEAANVLVNNSLEVLVDITTASLLVTKSVEVTENLSAIDLYALNSVVFSDSTIQSTAYTGDFKDITNTPFVEAPLTEKGTDGDEAGMISFDSDFMYFCVQDYTDGLEPIWKRVELLAQTWGGN
jgi:hypothetical protein